jgi:hypothetical protein
MTVLEIQTQVVPRRSQRPVVANPMQCNPMQCNPMQCNPMQCNAMQSMNVGTQHRATDLVQDTHTGFMTNRTIPTHSIRTNRYLDHEYRLPSSMVCISITVISCHQWSVCYHRCCHCVKCHQYHMRTHLVLVYTILQALELDTICNADSDSTSTWLQCTRSTLQSTAPSVPSSCCLTASPTLLLQHISCLIDDIVLLLAIENRLLA